LRRSCQDRLRDRVAMAMGWSRVVAAWIDLSLLLGIGTVAVWSRQVEVGSGRICMSLPS
jgi:hypothetical protein